MELEYTKNLSPKFKKQERINKKYQVVKELRRKYALKDLLEIAGFPKSVYYYYEHHKSTDKYHRIKILISDIFESSNKTYGYRRIKLSSELLSD